MKLIKNIALLFGILILAFAATSFNRVPVVIEPPIKNLDDSDKVEGKGDAYYWFYLRLKVNDRKNAYTIIGTGSRVISGTAEEFEKALWWGTKVGQIAVGPFTKHKEASDARLLYRRSRSKVIEGDDKHPEVHWFLITFAVRKRSGSFKFEHMPARLASGKPDEFLDALYEGMTFRHLAIGPFWDYVQAEEAKAMYRKNE